ncbi:MAG: hypothetical protein WBY94_23205 [Polyangiaceae bacterium]
MKSRPAIVALLSTVLAIGALAVGCGADNSLVGGSCAVGYTQCGLRCVKLASDPENCGACGLACQSGSACNEGVCSSLDASADAFPEDASDGSTLGDGWVDDGASGTATNAEAEATEATDDGASNGEGSVEEGATDGASASEPDASGAGIGDDSAADDGAYPVDPTESEDASSSDGGAGEASPNPNDEGGDESSATDAVGPIEAAPDSASDGGTTSDSTAGDGAPAEASNPCSVPLAYCGGACIDVSGDPLNCGGCGVVCASQLCDNSACVGAASGGIVYIGHDYTTTLPGTAQARVISNAVFVPESNPLRVLSYERYASPGAVTQVGAILRSVARQEGRTLTIVSTANDDQVSDQLTVTNYDVLLVHDQSSAPDGALATLGSNWGSTLSVYALGGGVIIVLDGGGGLGQMPAFATGTGLLDVSAHASIAVGTPLLVASRVDAIAAGVLSPYGAGQNSVSLTTEANGGNVVYVVELNGDAGSNPPVVVHKAF